MMFESHVGSQLNNHFCDGQTLFRIEVHLIIEVLEFKQVLYLLSHCVCICLAQECFRLGSCCCVAGHHYMAFFRFGCIENGALWASVVPPYESRIFSALSFSSNSLLNTTYSSRAFPLVYARGNSSRPFGLSWRENGPHMGERRLGSSIALDDSVHITREG